MKLKNKKTGEIGYPYFQNWKEITCVIVDENAIQIAEYTSLAELNEEWEDYEEAKTEFYITGWGDIREYPTEEERFAFKQKLEIGNYFSSREEAEKAVKKLKAWKRLKDKGFRFIGKTYETDKRFGSIFYKVDDDTYSEDIIDDLDLLFSGEDS